MEMSVRPLTSKSFELSDKRFLMKGLFVSDFNELFITVTFTKDFLVCNKKDLRFYVDFDQKNFSSYLKFDGSKAYLTTQIL